MKRYKQNYLAGTGMTISDRFLCENCGAEAVDIHHVDHKSQGGTDHERQSVRR